MQVSVVICTYSMDRYEVFSECVDSVLAQTYRPLEVVIVVDGNESVFERVRSDYGDDESVSVHCNDENRGISYSRTEGARLASGDVVAMIDDDATAEADWIAQHVRIYEERDAVAVAGPVEPEWIDGRPSFFPAEFYWLVGCTERGFARDGEEIRNGYGSNISYRRELFLDVGGYDEHTGRHGDRHIQAHEPPVCIRIRERSGKGVYYTERAVVHHKLFAYRGEFGWLVKRSFWQGYSKHIMDQIVSPGKENERAYLVDLATTYVPRRLKSLLRRPAVAKFEQLIAIVVFTGAVGAGYLYGWVHPAEGVAVSGDERTIGSGQNDDRRSD